MRVWHCANLYSTYIPSVAVYFSTSTFLKCSSHSVIVYATFTIHFPIIYFWDYTHFNQ